MIDRFSGLRCRPGDLAIIVQDEPECQANIGQIVRVLEEYTEFPDEWGFHWRIKPLSESGSPVLIVDPRTKTQRLVCDNQSRAHYDDWLRPILDTDEADAITQILGVPQESELKELVDCRFT